jgi:hypothetical protein
MPITLLKKEQKGHPAYSGWPKIFAFRPFCSPWESYFSIMKRTMQMANLI